MRRIKRRNAFISYLLVFQIFFLFFVEKDKPQGWELSHEKLHCSVFSLSFFLFLFSDSRSGSAPTFRIFSFFVPLLNRALGWASPLLIQKCQARQQKKKNGLLSVIYWLSDIRSDLGQKQQQRNKSTTWIEVSHLTDTIYKYCTQVVKSDIKRHYFSKQPQQCCHPSTWFASGRKRKRCHMTSCSCIIGLSQKRVQQIQLNATFNAAQHGLGQGVHTLLAWDWLFKWPGKCDLHTLETLNIYIYLLI